MAHHRFFQLGAFDAGKYSQAEKQARMHQLARLYAALPDFRLFAYSRPFSLDEPLEELRELMANAPDPRRREQIAHYRRSLEETVDAVYLKQTDYYLMLLSDEAPHILANQLMAGLRVPVREVPHLPALISGSYREMFHHYQPTRPGQPYLAFFYSYEMRGQIGFETPADFLSLPFPLALAVDVRTLPPHKAIGKLQMQINSLKADLLGRSGNEAPDPELEKAYQDAQRTLWQVQHERIAVHEMVLVLAIEGRTPAELETHTGQLNATALNHLLSLRPATGHQKEAYEVFTARPLSSTLAAGRRNLTSPGCALWAAPGFHTGEHKRGPWLAINYDTGSPLLIHKFLDLPAYNGLILGKTGSGKTFAAGLEALRSLIYHIQTVILDPQGNFEKLTTAVDGAYNRLRLGEGTALNVLDVVHDHPAAQNSHVMTLLELILERPLGIRERGAVDGALLQLYHRFDVRIGAFNPERMPLLEDLAALLLDPQSRYYSPDLAADLAWFVDGSLREIFNRHTTLNLTLDRRHPIITFDLSDLEGRYQPIFVYVLLSSIERTIRHRRQQQLPTNIVVDEFGILSRIPTLADAVGKLAKRVRAWKVGIQPIDQNWATFDNPAGREILENAQIKTIMRVDETAAPAIAANLGLTDRHRDLILNAQQGEGVMLIGSKPYRVYFQANPNEIETLSPYRRLVEEFMPLPSRN